MFIDSEFGTSDGANQKLAGRGNLENRQDGIEDQE